MTTISFYSLANVNVDTLTLVIEQAKWEACKPAEKENRKADREAKDAYLPKDL
jgi:hypothetical protein